MLHGQQIHENESLNWSDHENEPGNRNDHESELGERNDHENGTVTKTKRKETSSSTFLQVVVAVIFFIYIGIPFFIYFSPTLRRHAVFLHYVTLPRQGHLSSPADYGFNCTRNFYIDSGDSIKLGVWHIPSSSAMKRCRNGLIPAGKEFEDGRPVFLYLHGNGGTRATGHRMGLYKVLTEKANSHVITFDYRGFGDSSNVSPSEAGVVEDTYNVYKWLLNRAKYSPIFIWGHSLGTGVGVAFLHALTSSLPVALILESPFTKVADAAKYHPISFFYRHMPFFDELIGRCFDDEYTAFDSLSKISQVKCPILILHAEDDGFVPFEQGKMLFNVTVKERKNTHFVSFEGRLDYGHKKIYKDPGLPSIITQFAEKMRPKMPLYKYLCSEIF